MGNTNVKNDELSFYKNIFKKTSGKIIYQTQTGGKNKSYINFDENYVKNNNDYDIIYKYSQLNDQIDYNEAKKYIHPDAINIHLGQLKLFFSEFLFLTKYSQEANVVLYVGAAEGYHIAKLADLFPNLRFDLWDPRVFKIDERPNINIYRDIFTVNTSKRYRDTTDKILFMSDIRTVEIGKLKKEKKETEIDELVEDDMKKQADWIRIINPVYAYIKFRLPYYGYKSKYLGGTIYLQPYSPLGSETRLMTNNYNELIEYNDKEYDNKMAYFNYHIRISDKTYPRWDNVCRKYQLINCWDNAISLYITDYYLRKIRHVESDEKIGELFMDIIQFHKDYYGDKYNILFVKSS